jgi:hypothetical protein
MQLFVDMDGVLADFALSYAELTGRDAIGPDGLDWGKINASPGFFRLLRPMPDAHALIAVLRRVQFTILTAVSSLSPTIGEEKRAWIGEHISSRVPVITSPTSAGKYEFMTAPGDILIDDRFTCGLPWRKAGGIWVRHLSAAQTVAELEKFLPLLEPAL